MHTYQYRELILHYLSGQMAPEEVARFEAQLLDNSDLADELAEIMGIKEGFEHLNAPKLTPQQQGELSIWAANARQMGTPKAEQPTAPPPMRVQYLRRWSVAAAAAVALLVGVWWMIRTPQATFDLTVYAEQSARQAIQIGSGIAGMDHDSTDVRAKVNKIFTAGNYAEVIAYTDALPDTAIIADEVLLWRSMSLARIGRNQEAYTALKSLADDERVYEIFRLKATYEMAICKVAMDDKDGAAALLKSLLARTVFDQDKKDIQENARAFLADLSN
jgi:hypothetical protein